MGEFVWPVIEDKKSARDAASAAASWASLLALLNLGIATLLFGGNWIVELVGVAYGVAAWRIWQGSRLWAIAAFLLCILQTISAIVNLAVIWAMLMPFAFIALMNGVRGTAALQRLGETQKLKI